MNVATVVAPDGEQWKVISGKDQTNTRLDIQRGDVTVHYSSDKEDASAALALALKQQADIIAQIAQALSSLLPIATRAAVTP